MRIAYLVNQYPKVSHSFIRREILALEASGFEVSRIALRGWKEKLPDPVDKGEQVRTRYVLRNGLVSVLMDALWTMFRSPRGFARALRQALRMERRSERPLLFHLIYLAEACRVLRWLRRSACERLHAHFGTNSTEVAMLTRLLGGPEYSFTVHGPDEFMAPMGLDDKVHHASFAVAISCYGRSQLYLRSRHRDWAKIHVVHCGIESSFHNVTEVPIPANSRLVCVGRLCEAKGQLLLVEAAARLVESGVACEMVLVGDGPLRREIEALIESRGLVKHVRITGWVSSDRVRSEILAARALILPSFAEGLPVVLMEAMALRRPVLSTYIAGIPELVIPGEHGWLFPAGSIEDLMSAMQSCLSADPAMLARMGEAARARVLARHSIDREASKLADLFRAATPAG